MNTQKNILPVVVSNSTSKAHALANDSMQPVISVCQRFDGSEFFRLVYPYSYRHKATPVFPGRANQHSTTKRIEIVRLGA